MTPGHHFQAACTYGLALGMLAACFPVQLHAAEPVAESGASTTLPSYVVTASRMPQSPARIATTVDEFSADGLANTPALALDDALRGSAAFSLFRRSSSLIANPTAQGVSLRGLGPSGASRSLVLLEGIPLNDPFGGWIAWSKVPRLTLTRAEIVRGGGSGVWGNAALGGTVQLFAPSPEASGGLLVLEGGGSGTTRSELLTHFSDGANTIWQFGGRWFRTDGPMQYAPDQRGVIDRRFDSEHALGHVSVASQLRSGLRFTAGARVFDEDRGNGTPFQRNRSRENAAHARLVGELRPGVALDLLAYAQWQHFSSGFSAVDATRSSETPSLDQFGVPATAWGGAMVTTFSASPEVTTAIGADARAVRGETREDFFFSGSEFLRRRFAGGEQWTAGLFATHQREWAHHVTVQAAARLDQWRNHDGHRREWTKATGVVLRDESFADSNGTEFSPSLGLTWQATEDLTWRASAYRAFRVPTLNELFRPFRVGNVATEANPALRRETVLGGEIGATYVHEGWSLRVQAFHNDLHDGVGNVTLSSTPALTQRQRLNLDSIRVRGWEAGLGWNSSRRFTFAIDYLQVDARVVEADVAPSLEGRRLAQVPRHTITLRAAWKPVDEWRFTTAARLVSRQFEDDENSLPLASAPTVDLGIHRMVGRNHELHVAVENILDERVETSRTVGGLLSLGPGRVARAGWTLYW